MKRTHHLLAVLMAVVAVSVFSSCGGGPEGDGPASKAPGGAAPGSGEKVTLRLRLEAGKTYKTRMVAEQKITQTVQGSKQVMPQTMGFGFTYDVKEVRDDGTAVVATTFDSIQFKQQGPMGTIEYDSANPPETIPPMAKGFAALVGQSFTMEITPQGKVTKIDGAQQMLSRMLEQMEMPVPAMKATLEKMFAEQFGDDALREMMEQSLAIYPEGPVGIGESWSRKVTVSKGFPIVMDNTWTLKSRANGVAVVEVQSKVESNPNAAPLDMGVAKMQYDLSGTQNGTIELDEATGWVRRSTQNQSFSGAMTIQGGPQGTMTIPVVIESVVRLESPEG